MVGTEDLLRYLIDQRASDLHLKAGSVPFVRVAGRLRQTELPLVSVEEIIELIDAIAPPACSTELEDTGETDFALGVSGLGRFRVVIMRQRGSHSVVIRRVPMTPPTLEMLGLPAVIAQLSERRNGLLLVTGPAGSGKSTTVGAMIDHINSHTAASIVTIEDPIELLHADRQAFITQREVGSDTKDHLTALRKALRADPDVIYLDCISDAAVMDLVLSAAAGRLVISSLPSLHASDAIDNVIEFFPVSRSPQVRHALASCLRGIISQRLVDRADGRGRVAAFEVLVATARVHDSIIRMPGAEDIVHLIEQGDYYGMQAFDQHLAKLYEDRLVSLRDALAAAVRPQDLRVRLQAREHDDR